MHSPRIYPGFRVALAGFGIVLAAAWLAERTTLISTNPLEPVSIALVEHPLVVAAALAGAAAIAWARLGPTRRSLEPAPVQPAEPSNRR